MFRSSVLDLRWLVASYSVVVCVTYLPSPDTLTPSQPSRLVLMLHGDLGSEMGIYQQGTELRVEPTRRINNALGRRGVVCSDTVI